MDHVPLFRDCNGMVVGAEENGMKIWVKRKGLLERTTARDRKMKGIHANMKMI